MWGSKNDNDFLFTNRVNYSPPKSQCNIFYKKNPTVTSAQ